jgi:uncharacterized protein (DUF2336 family)
VLNELVQLAHEKSSDKRRELLRELSEQFLSGEDTVTDRASALFGSVVETLLDDMALDVRAEYAAMTAESEQMPKSIIMRLANDEISVASPILERSPLLDDDDLVSIVEKHGQDHMYAVAGRQTISEKVTDKLVERGESVVLRRVSSNQGAQLSETSFNTLTERASEDKELGSALAVRQDLPVQIAEKLKASVPPHARAKLDAYLKQAGAAGAVELARKAEEKFATEKRSDRQNRIEGKVLLLDIKEGRRNLDEVITDLAKQDRLFDIALILAEIAGLDDTALIRVLCAGADDPVAVACKASGLSDKSVEELGAMRCRRLRRPVRQAGRLVSLTHQLQDADAERVIRFARLRRSLNSSAKAS